MIVTHFILIIDTITISLSLLLLLTMVYHIKEWQFIVEVPRI